jgi:transcription antitermination factor NusG
VRWLKALAQFSPQYQRTRHKEGVFQIIGPTKRSIEKGVADGIVAAIRSRERNGLVELPKPPRLKRSDRVQIVQGPFREHLALYVGQTSPERVAVLLQLLGGQQRAELPADAIEPLRSAS